MYLVTVAGDTSMAALQEIELAALSLDNYPGKILFAHCFHVRNSRLGSDLSQLEDACT